MKVAACDKVSIDVTEMDNDIRHKLEDIFCVLKIYSQEKRILIIVIENKY